MVNWLYVVVGVNFAVTFFNLLLCHSHPRLNYFLADLDNRLTRLEAKHAVLRENCGKRD